MLGTFKEDVKILDNGTISVDGKPIKVVSSRDPLKLPWAELGIVIVIEGTGVFVDGPGAAKHIQAVAKMVIITAPAKGAAIPPYVVEKRSAALRSRLSDPATCCRAGTQLSLMLVRDFMLPATPTIS
ncbi:hypothetical protein JHK84_043610 [Glycine max]|nr:hypothetical protein JHK84_043610 [Glycine max]KAH1210572.1 Glyceraldehyde-3-phosphate dehydrogenase B, chloroplastic [Glycine max]